jgi:hypothetical protein
MITSKGNQIISKYLLGQTPEYAAYISVGVGATPLDFDEFDNSSITKKSMDFEAFRVPVLSKGLVNDTLTFDITNWSVSSNVVTITTSSNHGAKIGDEIFVDFTLANEEKEGTFAVTFITENTIKYEQTVSASPWVPDSGFNDYATISYRRERIIFKGELPTNQRYEMTEIALYPASNNTLAANYDSRVVSGFLTTEGWTYHDVSPSLVESDNTIPFVTTSIANTAGTINSTTFLDPVSSSAADALFVNSNNEAFTFFERLERYEPPRFYNRCLMVPGDMTSFSDDNMTLVGRQKYIFTNSIKLDLNENSPNDYIKFALSIISSDLNALVATEKVRLRFEFLDSLSGDKAVATELLESGDLSDGRYKIISKQIKDFDLGTDFSWGRIDGMLIYAQTLDSGGSYDGAYIAFDGIRIDNENTENPLYGMVAYSRLKNNFSEGYPILKAENSQGYIEYRLGVNIV